MTSYIYMREHLNSSKREDGKGVLVALLPDEVDIRPPFQRPRGTIRGIKQPDDAVEETEGNPVAAVDVHQSADGHLENFGTDPQRLEAQLILNADMTSIEYQP